MRSHLPLVRAMARRYARGREEFDELVQAGSVGLVKASSRFDPERGVAFATFVAPAVEGEMRRHLRDRSSGVRLPREKHKMTSELGRMRGELAASLGRPPDARELAAALDADLPEVEQLIAADLARHPVALGADDSEVELQADGEPQSESEYRVLLAGGLRVLDARERRIVFLRFHADMTERQIARTVGISQAHVSRLLEGALTKLRAELTRSGQRATPGDSAETSVISPHAASKIDPVGAQSKDNGAEDSPTAAPAELGRASASTGRRPSRSRAATGYSGRILVRMPSELHEQLALAAEREDVSLNRYVNDALSSSIESPPSPGAASTGAPGAGADDQGSRPRRLSAGGLRLALATNLAVVVIAAVVAVVLLVLALERGI
ncbi:MAG: sigma-70 family RNA polymerase sigma factor [Solirubrobacterales bacterium]|nr:sigma-70 family RNA polymerase sigma factor [Solirubrobacterales bacterium]MBV9806897.1 sigma-70 family RNA polymerase sigma factor [Solirubrobacterales bacterium]